MLLWLKELSPQATEDCTNSVASDAALYNKEKMYDKHSYLDRNRKLEARAKELRKNATKEENHLWYDFLKKQTVRFYRQYIIDNYIVDFFCPKAKLIIEIDGSQHYETDEALEYDKRRTHKLEAYGFMVLRFTNREINLYFQNVCDNIYQIVDKRIYNS